MARTLLALFAGSLLLFLAVLPGNHSEAEDAFEYSRLVEEGQGAELYHPHHLLYLSSQKLLYKTAQRLGYTGRSYYTARSASLFSGSAALCLFWLIAHRLQLLRGEGSCRGASLAATLGLLCSYGFVRYACEVEIYLPAMALCLVALHAALRARDSRLWFATGVVFAALAVLMHTINAALAILVIPVYYWWISRNPKHALIHGVATVALVGLVYLAVQHTVGLFKPAVDSATEGWFRPGTAGKAIVGFGQCLLSGNFVFSGAMAGKLQELFPYRVFDEEIFAAMHMPVGLRILAPWSFCAAAAGLFCGGILILANAVRKRRFDRISVVLLLWLAGTVFPTVILEPSNPELWILALAPLWALFLWLTRTLSLKSRSMVFVPVALLGCHNLLVGMGTVRSREGDYNFKKAEWVLQHATVDDVVHTSESFVFTFYLDYWGTAEVRNVNTQTWKAGDTTYVFDDVFNPSSAITVRYPDFAQHVAQVARELRPRCIRSHHDQFGGMWIVNRDLTE